MGNVIEVKNKGVPVDLDKPRILKFDLNSFAELEERYGSVEEAMEVLQSGTIKGIRTLLWCGLVHEEENLTEKQVGAMISIGDLAELSEKLNAAMSTALPAPEAPTAASSLEAPQVGNSKPSQ